MHMFRSKDKDVEVVSYSLGASIISAISGLRGARSSLLSCRD